MATGGESCSCIGVCHLSIFLQCKSLCAILDLDRGWSRTAKVHQDCMVAALDGAAHCLKSGEGAAYRWTVDACSEQEQRPATSAADLHWLCFFISLFTFSTSR